MTTPDVSPRAFRIPLKSLTMSERRILASKFGINWDVIEIDMSDIPAPADPDNPTTEEQKRIVREFMRLVGPNEQYALLYLAVKRELPHVTEAEIERHADAGEWMLDMSPERADQSDESEDGAGPLPPPPNSSTESS